MEFSAYSINSFTSLLKFNMMLVLELSENFELGHLFHGAIARSTPEPPQYRGFTHAG